jgi:7-keto-8-aminopelargonate synthetase-like enzyme
MPLSGRIDRNLDDLVTKGRLRSIKNTHPFLLRDDMPILDLSTNDYLGFAVDPQMAIPLQGTWLLLVRG